MRREHRRRARRALMAAKAMAAPANVRTRKPSHDRRVDDAHVRRRLVDALPRRRRGPRDHLDPARAERRRKLAPDRGALRKVARHRLVRLQAHPAPLWRWALRRLVEAELVKEDASGKRHWLSSAGAGWLRRPRPLRWPQPLPIWGSAQAALTKSRSKDSEGDSQVFQVPPEPVMLSLRAPQLTAT